MNRSLGLGQGQYQVRDWFGLQAEGEEEKGVEGSEWDAIQGLDGKKVSSK